MSRATSLSAPITCFLGGPVGPEPLLPAVVFDSSDVNVTPPVTLRLRLPSLSEDSPRQVGVVEAIVSTSGEWKE